MRLSCPLLAVTLVLAATGCADKRDPVSLTPALARCELDLSAHPELFAEGGEGAHAGKVEGEAAPIGGQFAGGREGDVLLENDRVRVVIGQPGRKLAHTPYGGNLLDADLRRAPGEPGRDQLAEVGFFYAFGRTLEVERVEVVRDGSAGGPAVVAATGRDVLNDYASLQQLIDGQAPGVKLVVNPDDPLPVRGTHWYVLSPGQPYVRVVTALCNEGERPLKLPVGDIWQGGGTMDLFNPGQCKGTLGEADCLIDPAPWVGWNGEGVAYGLRGHDHDAPGKPQVAAAVYLSNSIATLAGAKDLQGVLRWVDAEAVERPGTLLIPPGEQRLYVRDFVVGRDLAEVSATWSALDGEAVGTLDVQATSNGAGLEARVAVERAQDGGLHTVLRTHADGTGVLRLPAGEWNLTAAAPGRAFSATARVTVAAGAQQAVPLLLGDARTLRVTAEDPFGVPLPAKVVVRCSPGPCSPLPRAFARFTDAEPQPDDIAAIQYLPVQGALDLPLPPGRYEVFVSRGPEYSLFPDTAPALGHAVDLSAQDGAVAAVLARVVDTQGWMSADLHVHAVNSADASPPNELRVLSFLAEGVETLVSTDHDFVTDYAPLVESLGAQAWLSTVVGVEITPSWGHINAFPFPRTRGINGGALDWAGGAGPSLRPGQIFAEAKAKDALTLTQVNHPRGTQGLFSSMGIDTLTGVSHADPARFRMASPEGATEGDTGLFSLGFDALEVQNGPGASFATFNDWMTFLSRGAVRTATSVSDSHTAFAGPAGYGRTWVHVEADSPQAFDVARFSERLRTQRAVGSNGPFLQVTAQRLDAGGVPVGDPVGVGQTLSRAAGESVRLTVTVQAPEWMQFDRLELYTHADGREAYDGEPNSSWPASRISQSKTLDLGALPLEAVPGQNGLTFRRLRVVETFDVSPSRDAWYVVMVRSTNAARTLFPLQFRASCGDAGCTAGSSRPFAFTNPVFVDTDGSGAYDDFPIQVSQGLRVPKRRAALPAPWVPSLEQAEALLRAYHAAHAH